MKIAAELRRAVYRANMALVESGLVMGTFGNVSGVDRAAGLFVIKPSGVPYGALSAEDMVPISLETGRPLDGTLRPSSDTPTHLALYRAFECGGISHTHSAPSFSRPVCTGWRRAAGRRSCSLLRRRGSSVVR